MFVVTSPHGTVRILQTTRFSSTIIVTTILLVATTDNTTTEGLQIITFLVRSLSRQPCSLVSYKPLTTAPTIWNKKTPPISRTISLRASFYSNATSISKHTCAATKLQSTSWVTLGNASIPLSIQ